MQEWFIWPVSKTERAFCSQRFESSLLRMKFEFSAGGVVFRRKTKNKKQTNFEILLGQHSQHHGWVFPKGIIGDHPSSDSGRAKETQEDAALREVEEETGIVAKIVKPLKPATYWYNFEGEKIKKTVYYFLMEFVGGDTKNHDWEMEKVEWILKEEVENRLTYKSDREVWQEAKKLIVSN